MRKLSFFCVVLVLGFSGVEASQQYDDLVKLVKAGVGEEAITAYINESDFSYNLSSDEIVHLTEYGASPIVIMAAIQHKAKVLANSNSQAMQAEPASIVPPPPYTVYRVPPSPSPRRALGNSWYEHMGKMNQAIQVDMIGLYSGTFTLNYEYLLNHQHGIVLEGSYSPGWNDYHGENVELAYRWHWARSMNSGFCGVFVSGGRSYGTGQDPYGNGIPGYTLTSVTIGPNIGKRWVTPWGFNVVGRIGYGYSWGKFDGPAPDQATINQLQFETGMDAELSFGFAF